MRDRYERWWFRASGVLTDFDDRLSVRVKTLDNGQELVFAKCCLEVQTSKTKSTGLRHFSCPRCCKVWNQIGATDESRDSEEHSEDGHPRSGQDADGVAGGCARAGDDDLGDAD